MMRCGPLLTKMCIRDRRRLAQLIKEDRFYTEEEQDRFDNIDPVSYTHLSTALAAVQMGM